MPTWLRKFTYQKIKQYYDDQNNKSKQQAEESWLKGAAREEAKQKSKAKTPTYTSTMKKASKK